MNELSERIFNEFQTRKTKNQKSAFIDLIKNNISNVKIEQGGFLNNRNIIVGDVEKAKIIFSAHYDTCAVLPFPNLITPKNILLTILYSLFICIPFLIVANFTSLLLTLLTESFTISYYSSIIVFFTSFIAVFMAGVPNKHTANDNTSGVITLIELMSCLSDEEKEKCAFVFFDNEENGLLGSAFFRKTHKKQLKNKLLINFDCVGDGDNIIFVSNKSAQKEFNNFLKQSFSNFDEKKVLFENSTTCFYPSDQIGFPKSIAVTALKKKRFIGLYMDKIHTKHDTICDKKNINFICNGFKTFLNKC